MKAVDGSRIEPIGLNYNDALNHNDTLNLSETINGSNVTIQHLDRLYYTDRRVVEKTKTNWQIFSEAFYRSAGLSTDAALISAIGVFVFNIIKAQNRNSD